jgi:hypothetical protein
MPSDFLAMFSRSPVDEGEACKKRIAGEAGGISACAANVGLDVFV